MSETSNTTRPVDLAIRRYHDLVTSDWRAVLADLERETSARRISFLGRPVVRALRPAFVDESTYEDAMRAARLVGRAVHELARVVAGDDALRSRLRLSTENELLVRAEPDPEPIVARLDGFFADDGTLRFLEYNPNPFGTVFSEQVAEIFAAMPILEKATAPLPSRYARTAGRLVSALLRAHGARSRCGRRSPNVAVVLGAAGSARLGLTEGAHMMELAARGGAVVRPVSAESIVRRDGALFAGDFPIDCLSFGDNDEFLQSFPKDHSVWTALQNREVWLFGSLAAMALHGNKGLFAFLTEPDLQSMFDRETQAAIRRHVPWTRLVRDERTTYGDRAIDLLSFIRRDRERWVIKPTVDFGGKGVVLGWHVSAEAWDRAIEDALESKTQDAGVLPAHPLEHAHVVQERVPNRVEPFPRVVGDELAISDHRVDFNPYLWNGVETEGALVRVAEDDLLNITAGAGSLAPLFILGET